jgi:hypothetical protein
MRYYDLDANGKVKGSYAVPQPDMTLHLIEDAPDSESKWDGAWIPDLPVILEKKAGEVNAVREKKIAAGIPYEFPDGKGTIQTRDLTDARNIQTSIVSALILQAAGETGPVMVFRDVENVSHKMTPAQVLAMGLYVAQYGQGIYTASWTIKDKASTLTAKEVKDFDIEKEWPTTIGG